MCPHGYHHSGSMATPALGSISTYIYTQEWLLPVVQNVIMKMRIAETEMKM